MKTTKPMNLKDWQVHITCGHCNAEHVVGFDDVWEDTWSERGLKRQWGLMCNCSQCGHDIGITNFPKGIMDLVPPDKQSWLGGSGALHVPAPESLVYHPEKFGTSKHHPARRLLAGIVSVLQYKYRTAEDCVLVELIMDNGNLARPEFEGCLEPEVVAEVVRRLRENWQVEEITSDSANVPTALRLSKKENQE